MREFFARAARVIYLLRLKLDEVLDAAIPVPYSRTRPSHGHQPALTRIGRLSVYSGQLAGQDY